MYIHIYAGTLFQGDWGNNKPLAFLTFRLNAYQKGLHCSFIVY